MMTPVQPPARRFRLQIPRYRTVLIASLFLFAVIGIFLAAFGRENVFAQQQQQGATNTLSDEVRTTVTQMGQTLRADQFSFQARTIRVAGQFMDSPIHIFHTMQVTIHRPNKARIDISGDDGISQLNFDGKDATIYSERKQEYAKIPIKDGTLRGMVAELVDNLDADLPLADLLMDSPGQSFLSGVESGVNLGTVQIDGAPYNHLLLNQPPDLSVELWVAKDAKALPKRMIITYLEEPSTPRLIVEFSDWDFNVHPSDADFAFQAPNGARQVELKPPEDAVPAKK